MRRKYWSRRIARLIPLTLVALLATAASLRADNLLSLPMHSPATTSLLNGLSQQVNTVVVQQPLQNLQQPLQNLQNPMQNLQAQTAPLVQELGGGLSLLPSAGTSKTSASSFSGQSLSNQSTSSTVPGGVTRNDYNLAVPSRSIVYHADYLALISGVTELHTVRQSDTGHLTRPETYAAHGANVSYAANNDVILRSGQLLVSMNGHSGTGMITAGGHRIYISKSANALISTVNQVTRIDNISGPRQSVIVYPSAGEQVLSVNQGYELALGDRVISTGDVVPPDNIARRSSVLIGDGEIGVSELSLASVLKNTPLISSLYKSGGRGAWLVNSVLIKAAAAQMLVRGVEGFAVSTVEASAGSMVPPNSGVLPIIPAVNLPQVIPPAVLAPDGSLAPAPGVPPVQVLAQSNPSSFNVGSLVQSTDPTRELKRDLPPAVPPGANKTPYRQANKSPSRRSHRPSAQATPPAQSASAGKQIAIPPTLPICSPNTSPSASPLRSDSPHSASPSPSDSPLSPLLKGVPLNGIPGILKEEIKKHPSIAAAVMALIATLLLLTCYFWHKSRQRAHQLSLVNAELRIARDQALESSHLKSEFLANISHEIRTPITVILGITGMLFSSNLDEKQREMGLTLKNAANGLLDIITGVLDFSKIEAGSITLESVPFSVSDLIKEVESAFSLSAAEKGLVLTASVDLSVPSRVIGDPIRFKQILMNLVNNAVKFTSSGSVAIRASATLDQQEKAFVRVSVADTGIGISESERARIFSPFVQADASTTRRFGGTGLGLSISNRLSEVMGGAIELSSVPGVGSEFVALIPFQTALETPPLALEPFAAAVTSPLALESSAAAAVAKPTADNRILVAEDSPLLQKIVKAQLEGMGYEVDLATNGQEAVQAVQNTRYALILMDWQMPGMDGLQASRAIRELNPELGSMPIIAMTANAMESDRQCCLEAGMSDYLSKPVTPQQLKSRLEYWLGQQAV